MTQQFAFSNKSNHLATLKKLIRDQHKVNCEPEKRRNQKQNKVLNVFLLGAPFCFGKTGWPTHHLPAASVASSPLGPAAWSCHFCLLWCHHRPPVPSSEAVAGFWQGCQARCLCTCPCLSAERQEHASTHTPGAQDRPNRGNFRTPLGVIYTSQLRPLRCIMNDLQFILDDNIFFSQVYVPGHVCLETSPAQF